MGNKLWLTEAMKVYNKRFDKDKLNIVNSHAGSGKTTFVFDDLLKNYKDYGINQLRLNKIIYVCDTSSLVYRILINKSDICKEYETGDLDNLMDNKGSKIIVITYAKLGLLFNNKLNRDRLLSADAFLLDEIHNLTRYSYKFDEKNENIYKRVLQYLPDMIRKSWGIGLSATFDEDITYGFNENGIRCKNIFNYKEKDTLRSYNFKPRYINYVFNILKEYVLLKDTVFKDNIVNNEIIKRKKLLIYTNTIKQADRYKQYFIENDIKAEWLCSINAKEEDEYGKEILRMNDGQLKIRESLLDTGYLNEDLDVIIINGAYETGIDIYNEEIQHVIIDNTNDITQVQSRNRVRHDIESLYLTCRYEEIMKDEFIVPTLDKYKNFIDIKSHVYVPNLAVYIEDTYLNIKLTEELKNEMIYKYSVKKCLKESNDFTFKSLKEDINKLRYKVYTSSKNGTWIFKYDDLTNYMKETGIEKYTDSILEDYRRFICSEVKEMDIELYDYLDSLVGKKIYKVDREYLAQLLNVRKDGKLKKSINAIITGLEDTPYEVSIKDVDWERIMSNGEKNSNYGKSYFVISETCI